jgi:polyphenol oxidase
VPHLRLPLDDGRLAQLRFTDRGHGDLAVDGDPDELAARRRAVADLPWTWLRQVPGARVVTVDRPGDACGGEADAAVTAASGAAIAVHAADCAPVAVVASGGAIAVVHAGWRGLVAGVIPEAVAELRRLGSGYLRAVLGPCIRAGRYEFGAGDLDAVAERLGPSVRGRTEWGTPALDLPAAVRAALASCGVHDLVDVGVCTAADPAYYSHRRSADHGRHALVAWIDDAPMGAGR